MSDRGSPSTIPVLLALTAASLWGVSAAVAADAFTELSPARVAQMRSTIAALVLLPLMLARKEVRFQGLGWEVIGFGVNLAAVHVVFYWALQRLGVGVGVTLEFLGPLLVLLWMRRVQDRQVHVGLWGAAAVSVLGTFLITRAWDTATLDLAGVGAGLGSAVLFGSYLVWGERLGRRLPSLTVMTGAFVTAAAIWAVILPLWRFPPVSHRIWLELAWIGIVGTAVAFLVELAALRRAPAGTVGIVTTAEPFVAALAAWLLLDQTIAPVQIAGGVVIVGAVAAAQRWGLAEMEVPFEAGR